MYEVKLVTVGTIPLDYTDWESDPIGKDDNLWLQYFGSSKRKEARLVYEHWSSTYYIGWRLKWASLKSWLDNKKLHRFPKYSLDPEAFIADNPGLYKFSWVTDEGPMLTFEGIASTPKYPIQYEPENFHNISVSFWMHEIYRQNVRFQFGIEATRIPPKQFKRINGFDDAEKIELREDNGRYQADCYWMSQYISRMGDKLENLLTVTLNLEDPIKFRPDQFVIKGDSRENPFGPRSGSRCPFLIEKSETENEWVLGSSFLRAISVSIDTRFEKYGIKMMISGKLSYMHEYHLDLDKRKKPPMV